MRALLLALGLVTLLAPGAVAPSHQERRVVTVETPDGTYYVAYDLYVQSGYYCPGGLGVYCGPLQPRDLSVHQESNGCSGLQRSATFCAELGEERPRDVVVVCHPTPYYPWC